jgi:hypothetical protein
VIKCKEDRTITKVKILGGMAAGNRRQRLFHMLIEVCWTSELETQLNFNLAVSGCAIASAEATAIGSAGPGEGS